VFRIQKVSNQGTSTPAVVRTFLQGCEVLEFFTGASKDKREEAKKPLWDLQRHLIRCVEVRDSIAKEVAAAHEEVRAKGLAFQSAGRAITLPNVPDLQSRAESFLQSAKLAIRETARLVEPLLGGTHDHRYHKLAAWAAQRFGPDDKFTLAIEDWEPWVKSIVDMRNAVDHPTSAPGGELIAADFTVVGVPPALELIDPRWGLSGQTQRPMLPEMDDIIEGIIRLGEDILAGLFHKLKGNFPLVLYEIPAEERDPQCPKRLRVGLAHEPS
jgi:hypothetical protein